MGAERILVAGFAVAGQAIAKHYATKGYELVIFEENLSEKKKKLAASFTDLIIEDVNKLQNLLPSVKRIVLSPGIPPSHKLFFYKTNAEIVGELEVGFENANANLIAVTGTNGKSTVVAMINHILTSAGFKSDAVGNFGTPLIDKANQPYDYLVIEASSFQLYSVKRFKPDIGVFLNLAPDHLDWHPSLKHYIESKFNLFKNFGSNEIGVINCQDQVGARLIDKISSVLSFGYSKGDVYYKDGQIVLKNNKILIPDHLGSSYVTALNMAAAASVAFLVGIAPDAIEKALTDFKPLDHRCEEFLKINGISFINDSKSTTPASTVAALKGKENVILIMGGKNKGLEFDEVFVNAKRIKKLILIGESKDEIRQSAKRIAPEVNLIDANSMQDAVNKAIDEAVPGDTIMLSPACSSFDWYDNYAQRGNHFKKLVMEVVLSDER